MAPDARNRQTPWKPLEGQLAELLAKFAEWLEIEHASAGHRQPRDRLKFPVDVWIERDGVVSIEDQTPRRQRIA